MTDMQAHASHSERRGITKPETASEKRRRKQREAVAAIKYHKAALKEARERYLEYDQDARTGEPGQKGEAP